MKNLVYVSLLIGCYASFSFAELRIGVIGRAPFIEDINGVYSGYAIDVFEKIAGNLKLQYAYTGFQDEEAGFLAVENGQIDVLIGAIALTSQHTLTTLPTQPITSNALAILMPNTQNSAWDNLKPLMQKISLALVITVIASLFVVGTLIWHAEKKVNSKHFPKSSKDGVLNGVWFAIVTMTGVGYGDKYPITHMGRLITGVWMIAGLVLTSIITGGIVAALTVSSQSINIKHSIEELRNKPVAVIEGFTNEFDISSLSSIEISLPSFDEALAALKNKQVTGILFSRPEIRYYLKTHPDSGLELVDVPLPYQSMGFLLPEKELGLFKRINVEILRLKEAGIIESLQHKWL